MGMLTTVVGFLALLMSASTWPMDLPNCDISKLVIEASGKTCTITNLVIKNNDIINGDYETCGIKLRCSNGFLVGCKIHETGCTELSMDCRKVVETEESLACTE